MAAPSFNNNNNNNNTNNLNNPYVPNNSINVNATESGQISQREKFHKAILKISQGNADDILELILTLSTRERRLCYFSADYLNKRIHEAIQALEVVTNDDSLSTSPSTPNKQSIENTPISTPTFLESTDSINNITSVGNNNKSVFPKVSNQITSTTTTSTTSSSTRNASWEEIQQFMDSIKAKPVHERKQKLGDRLFRKVKVKNYLIFNIHHPLFDLSIFY